MIRDVRGYDPHDIKNKKSSTLEDAIEEIERLDQIKLKQERVKQWYLEIKDLFSKKGLVLSSNIQNLYQEIRSNESKYYVRKEQPKKVLQAIFENKPLTIQNPGNIGGNIALPNESGIKIAFSEGTAKFPISTVIVFKRDGLDVEMCGQDMRENRQDCRIANGIVPTENIEYLLLRIPKTFMEESEIEPDEEEDFYIFRGIKMV